MPALTMLASLFNPQTPWNLPFKATPANGPASTLLSPQASQALGELAKAVDETRDPPRLDRAAAGDQALGTDPVGVALTFDQAGDFSKGFALLPAAVETTEGGAYLLTVQCNFVVSTITVASLIIRRNGADYRRMTQSAVSPQFGGYWSTLVQAADGDEWSAAVDFPTGGSVTALADRRLQMLRVGLA